MSPKPYAHKILNESLLEFVESDSSERRFALVRLAIPGRPYERSSVDYEAHGLSAPRTGPGASRLTPGGQSAGDAEEQERLREEVVASIDEIVSSSLVDLNHRTVVGVHATPMEFRMLCESDAIESIYLDNGITTDLSKSS